MSSFIISKKEFIKAAGLMHGIEETKRDMAALAEMGLVQNVLAAPFEPFGGKELVQVRAALRRLRG